MSGYLSIGLVVLCFIVIQFFYARKRTLKKKNQSFQDDWGKVHSKNRRLDRIALLHELAPPDFVAIHHLDEETRNDIDLSSLFDLVD